MAGKYVAPSPRLSAFSCPHCGTYTTQFWSDAGGRVIGDNGTPSVWTPKGVEEFRSSKDAKPLLEVPDFWTSIEKHASGEPFLEGEISYHQPIINLFISRCYECNRLSIWRHDSLIWPARADAPEANPDLPPHVAADFNEAGAVLAISPRAAAALLRLCIQKLCAFLGEKGRNIDDDIASLVAKGLDPRVKKALDIVRVVGNEAVHPGTMDLKDDRATAEELFRLVNLIAEIMISQPKHIAEMYATLPPAKLEAIERRDQKVIEPPKADE